MEEKEKKSFFSRLKSFFKKIVPGKKAKNALAAAAVATAVLNGSNVEAAENSKEINLQELSGDFNAKVTQASPVNTQTATKVMPDGTIVDLSMDKNNPVAVINKTKDTVNAANRTIQDVQDIINGRGNIFDKSADAVKQVEKVSQILNNPQNKNEKIENKSENNNDIVVTPVEKDKEEIITEKPTDSTKDITVEKQNTIEVEKSENNIASTQEADAMVNHLMHIYEFDHINNVPRSEEEKLSEVLVHLKTEISAQKIAGNNSLANSLEAHRIKLEGRRQELTLARLHLGDPADYKSPLDKLREQAPKEVKQDNAVKIDDIEDKVETDNTITVANDEKPQDLTNAKSIIIENEKDSKMGNAKKSKTTEYRTYKKKERSDDKRIYSWEEINKMGTIGSILDNTSTVKSSDVSSQDIKTENIDISEKKPTSNVSKSNLHLTESDLCKMLDDLDAKKSNTEFKVDESKLADVSAGQMGTMETLDDEEKVVTQKKKPGTIDESKLNDVSFGQMGVLEEDDINDILDQKQAFNNSLKVNNDVKVTKDSSDKLSLVAKGLGKPGQNSNDIDQQILNLQAEKVQAIRAHDIAKANQLNSMIAELSKQKADVEEEKEP